MITFDGHRSMLRRPFAEKKLEQIKEIDVPSKAIKWNGFTIRVWQQGWLSGGHIMAPMGAVVLFSTDEGVQVLIADHWLGPFESRKDLHTLYFPNGGQEQVLFTTGVDDEALVAAGCVPVRQRPVLTHSPFGLTLANEETVGTVYVQDQAASPVVLPVPGQERLVVFSNNNQFVDLNENETPDLPKYLIDWSEMFYAKDGSSLRSRESVLCEDDGASATFWRVVRPLNDTTTAVWQTSSYQVQGGKILCAQLLAMDGQVPIFLDDLVPQESGMPTALWALLMDASDPGAWPLGTYMFKGAGNTLGMLHCADMTSTIRLAPLAVRKYFASNPGDKDWKLCISLWTGGSVYIYHLSQFRALLNSVAGRPLDDDSALHLRQTMNQFVCVWPQNNFTAPHDSAMFHDHEGNVCTWTRACGAVKFSPSGMHAISLEIPDAVVNTQGVRPEIIFTGVFDDAPLYLCVCNKVGENIVSVEYGSPYVGWDVLPGIDSLLHVRPVRATPESIVLLGVVQEESGYRLAHLEWSPENGAEWQLAGRLPVELSDNCSFCAGLFGAGQYVKDLATFETPPYALPQMPAGPYEKYATGLPCQS